MKSFLQLVSQQKVARKIASCNMALTVHISAANCIKQVIFWDWAFFIILFPNTVFSQLNAPGVYFKLGPMDLAFIRSQRLIEAWRLLKKCFFFCHFIKLIYYHPTSETQQTWLRRTIFPFILSDKLSLVLLIVTHHSIQHAYYCMLQSRCVKKEHKQYMLNIEER